MGSQTGVQIDNWLQSGGLVLTASERAARALVSAFHQRRRDEGLSAWPAPAIHTFAAFVGETWESHTADDRLVLNTEQEQSLWASILAREPLLPTLLEGPRQRLAAFAADAHALLCSHAPRYLNSSTRASWDRDTAAFSRWLADFDAACARHRVLSPARIPLELVDLLQNDPALRPPLLIAGFDRLLAIHRALFDAWGSWQELTPAPPASECQFHSASDESAEFSACASWCAEQLATRPASRLLVLTQSLSTRRGALERAFLRSLPASAFEFSLGVPLDQVPLVRATSMLLRWLGGSLLESEIDWLLSTSYAATSEEAIALQSYMYALRRAGRARPQWTLDVFLAQSLAVQPLALWARRFVDARRRLSAVQASKQTTLDWSTFALELLGALGLPGDRLASAEYQAWQRFQAAVETAASLGFDDQRIFWSDFLAQLARILADALFAPESHNAPIQIAGPAEAAGLTADAVWFLGASEEQWPAPGSTHPFLPLYVQRESNMPHASAQLDWQLANTVTGRVLSSAPHVVFSFAQRTEDTDARPSRLIVQQFGSPCPLPAELKQPEPPPPQTVQFPDDGRIPFPQATVSGGSSVLTRQSQCPFQAFATARLGALKWDPAEFGLSVSQRGQLLHAVLHSVWGGPPHGLRSLADLLGLSDVSAFVTAHVDRAMHHALPDGARDRMPTRYLDLEAERLVSLVTEWLAYESTRVDFTVEQTEADATAAVASLVLKLRLDRIDRLADGTLAVIDYKSGNVAAKAWDLPRPEDVQLPLYATFALHGESPGGLLFAKLRAGDSGFSGRVRDARATLFRSLNGRDTLVRKPLTDEDLDAWRSNVEDLAHDFISGRAVVDPREFPGTCDRCGLHSICRIHENHAALESVDDEEARDD